MARAVTQVRTAGGKRPQLRKPKREQWNKRKQERFLAELAATCNVAASCRAVKMSDQSVYRLRQRSPEFRAGWEAALCEGYARLEMMMLERMLNGTVKPVFHGGKQVGEVTEYPNAVALQLMRQHAPAVRAASQPVSDEEAAAMRAELAARLDEMAARLAATAVGDAQDDGDGDDADAEA